MDVVHGAVIRNQAGVDHHTGVQAVGVDGFLYGLAHGFGVEGAALVDIYADQHHHLVEQGRRLADDVVMTVGVGIKGAREQGDALFHGCLRHSRYSTCLAPWYSQAVLNPQAFASASARPKLWSSRRASWQSLDSRILPPHSLIRRSIAAPG